MKKEEEKEPTVVKLKKTRDNKFSITMEELGENKIKITEIVNDTPLATIECTIKDEFHPLGILKDLFGATLMGVEMNVSVGLSSCFNKITNNGVEVKNPSEATLAEESPTQENGKASPFILPPTKGFNS